MRANLLFNLVKTKTFMCYIYLCPTVQAFGLLVGVRVLPSPISFCIKDFITILTKEFFLPPPPPSCIKFTKKNSQFYFFETLCWICFFVLKDHHFYYSKLKMVMKLQKEQMDYFATGVRRVISFYFPKTPILYLLIPQIHFLLLLLSFFSTLLEQPLTEHGEMKQFQVENLWTTITRFNEYDLFNGIKVGQILLKCCQHAECIV